MEKPKYTYEDWKSGKLWYEKESDMPRKGLNAITGFSGDDENNTGFEVNKLFVNRPEFIHLCGEMEFADLEKAKAEQQRLFKLILDEQVDARKPARIRDLVAIKSDKLVLQARINVIEKQLLAHPVILFNLKQGKYPILSNLTGPQYKQIVMNQAERGKYLAQRPEYELHKYIEVALLDMERDLIKQEIGLGDPNPPMKTKPADGRGDYGRSRKFVMGDDFYAEANRIYRKALVEGVVDSDVRSSRSGLVRDSFVALLSNFMGYEARDTQRLKPKKPSELTIKRRLVDNRERWEY